MLVLPSRRAVPRGLDHGPLGGGLGLRHWAINAEVPPDYACEEPPRHLVEVGRQARGLRAPGWA